MKIIESRASSLTNSAREADLKRWIARFATSEAAAAGAPDAKLLHYRISYRLSTRTSGIDTYDHRRRALIEIIQSVKGEHHVATTTWDVSLHITSAETLIKLLRPPLDASLDALRVVEVSKGNRGSFGVDELES